MKLEKTLNAINEVIEKTELGNYGLTCDEYEPGVGISFSGVAGILDRSISLELDAKNIEDLVKQVSDYADNFDYDYEVTELIQNGKFPFDEPGYPKTVGVLLGEYKDEEKAWDLLASTLRTEKDNLLQTEIQEVAEILNKYHSYEICEALPKYFIEAKAEEVKENLILNNVDAIIEDKLGNKTAEDVLGDRLDVFLADKRETLDDQYVLQDEASQFIDRYADTIEELKDDPHYEEKENTSALKNLLKNLEPKEFYIAYDMIKEPYIKNKVMEYCLFEDTKSKATDVLVHKLGYSVENEKFDELCDTFTQEVLENSYYHNSTICEQIEDDVLQEIENYKENNIER